MNFRKLNSDGQRRFVLICEPNDDAAEVLQAFAREHQVKSAGLTAIGAFERVSLGYYQIEKQEYATAEFEEQLEVVSFIGDISMKDGDPLVHVHVALGRPDFTLIGGHLMSGMVRPTLEIMMTETPTALERKYDPASGLSLIAV